MLTKAAELEGTQPLTLRERRTENFVQGCISTARLDVAWWLTRNGAADAPQSLRKLALCLRRLRDDVGLSEKSGIDDPSGWAKRDEAPSCCNVDGLRREVEHR